MAAHYDKYYEELADEARKRDKQVCNCKGCEMSRNPAWGYQPCHKRCGLDNPPKGE